MDEGKIFVFAIVLVFIVVIMAAGGIARNNADIEVKSQFYQTQLGEAYYCRPVEELPIDVWWQFMEDVDREATE